MIANYAVAVALAMIGWLWLIVWLAAIGLGQRWHFYDM
jgi:hypothetical protein